MTPNRQAKKAIPYIRRLLEDEYVQEQLRDAVIASRATYLRVRRQPAQATDDRRVYRGLRQASTAYRNALAALRPPEPEPKRRVRKVLVVATAAAFTAWLTMKLQRVQEQGATEPTASPGAAESPTAAHAVGDPEPAGTHTI